MRLAIGREERLARMESNMLAFDGPRLERQAEHPEVLSIVGYGPSLEDTWGQIHGHVLTCSGAHDFLLDHGIVPDLHVEIDPRDHKFRFLRRATDKTVYLISSACHPWTFRQLRGKQVVMWHAFTDDDVMRQVALVERLQPGGHLLAGGTNAGIRALSVGLELGFRRFEFHGIDCCYRGEKQWAGPHYGTPHQAVKISVEGREFDTSDVMMQSTDDFFNVLPMLMEARRASSLKFNHRALRIHGGGLLAARVAMYMRDPDKALSPRWWQPVNFTLRIA